MAFFGACFTGDMLLLCEGGKKRADAIKEGNWLWSRDEHDPDGPLVLKRVLRRFERTAKLWHVRLPGQVLRTTVEHPFWVENRQSWLPVAELHVGDMVRSDSGELLPVEGIEDSGKWERVYRLPSQPRTQIWPARRTFAACPTGDQTLPCQFNRCALASFGGRFRRPAADSSGCKWPGGKLRG